MTSLSFVVPTDLSARDVTAQFVGARLPICNSSVLIVAVAPAILFDMAAAEDAIARFRGRFSHTIVLMAQSADGRPTYYGPAGIVRVIARLAFAAIPWQWFSSQGEHRYMWWLPIPPKSRRELKRDIGPRATRAFTADDAHEQTTVNCPSRSDRPTRR